jgi:formate hydrogenlyase subunit 6/NADH:ubiquinone oxidoreductase subunit I
MAFLLKKGDFSKFIDLLISNYDVIAPVKDEKNISKFELLSKGMGDKLIFNVPLYPAKDWFMPIKEQMLKFKGDKLIDVKAKDTKKVFFMNRCDVNAIHRNDLIMLDNPGDPYYKRKRDSSYLIEIPCVVTEHCNCTNLGLIDCFDLKLIEDKKTNCFILHSKTKKGEELLKKAKKKLTLKSTTFDIKTIIPYEHKQIKTDNKKVWKNYEKDCLSCSACTVVCPTCVCFNISGHLDLSLDSGSKYREWSSCQLKNYTKIAGGFVFRDNRGARGKQRIHCKFVYFKEKYDYARCVGCGRCNQACPVGINIYDYYSRLK